MKILRTFGAAIVVVIILVIVSSIISERRFFFRYREAKPHFDRAVMLANANDLDAAIDELNIVLKIFPEHEPARENLDLYEKRRYLEHNEAAQDDAYRLKHIEILLRKGKFAEACAITNKFVDTTYLSVGCKFLTNWLGVTINRVEFLPQDEVSQYSRMITENRTNDLVRERLIIDELKKGEYDEAQSNIGLLADEQDRLHYEGVWLYLRQKAQ